VNPFPSLHPKTFLTCTEELPVRLAHRVKELDELPHNLSAMPSINKVKNWYAQSFEASPFPQTVPLFMTSQQELITFPPIVLPLSIRQALMVSRSDDINFPESKPNPSQSRFVDPNLHTNPNSNSFNKLKLRVPMERRYLLALLPLSFIPFTELRHRYYANTNGVHWPPEVQDYNKRFTKMLEHIKSRHDPTVTTVAQGVLEWKRSQNARQIGLDIQAWLDRFYLSRIGIRFLIGQRELFFLVQCRLLKFLNHLPRCCHQHTPSARRLCRYNMYSSRASPSFFKSFR
jgi:pyruvate dehydrogenase kinase 2/3/4